jgi:tetratricopeptide (TPR) repeat protein
MKAEHRKELMTNTLANRLGEAIQGMKEGPSRGTMLFLGAIGLILLLVLVWRYFATGAEESDSARWLKWDNLASPEQLKSFADNKEVQGHIQGRLARLEEARRALYDGLRNLGDTNVRKEALTDIRKAADLYGKLADELAEKPSLHQQALMGAAKAYESLGEIDQARKYYQLLTQKYPKSLGEEAGEQLKRLDAAEQSGDLQALREEYNSPSATPK